MELKKIIIDNFKQFSNIELDLESDLTMIAGANNSGKTSLISLIRNILKNDKTTYGTMDIPATLKKKWISEVYPIFSEFFLNPENDINSIEDKLITRIIPIEQEAEHHELDTTSLKFIITYNPEYDDIKLFADYIMDLDVHEHYFYFYVTFKINRTSFTNIIADNFKKLRKRFNKLSTPVDTTKQRFLFELIIKLYVKALECKCYFCNKDFSNKCPIDELSTFRNLFNIRFIEANRPLDDDESDHSHLLNHQMMKMVEKEPSWIELMTNLPDTLLEPKQVQEVKDRVQTTSLDSLQDSILALEKTSGGQPSQIMLDLDITEDNVHDFLEHAISTSYEVDGICLGEASQGLGYSNMIYMHLQLMEYVKNMIDSLKVNIFIIEEPEAHMHPQMQQVFVKYLLKYYGDQCFQGIITTHSNEMVRVTGLKHLRVIRKCGPLMSKLYNLSTLLSNDTGDEELNNFYDWFFEIGYSEVVFADKVIFYEGDTERLFIRKLLSMEKYKTLGQQYIAFVQVGGAYAHNYEKLIKLLNIKALIITDSDYDKKCVKRKDIENATSTNAAINFFYKKKTRGKMDPKMSELYEWANKKENKLENNLIYLAFQTNKDAYGRTLEEAMLCKYFSLSVESRIKRSKWKELKKSSKLQFSIPNNKKSAADSNFTLRDILKSSSGVKTNFMYSVILQNYTESMEPNYIKEGLQWLMED